MLKSLFNFGYEVNFKEKNFFEKEQKETELYYCILKFQHQVVFPQRKESILI